MKLSDSEKEIFEIKRVFIVLSNVCNCKCIMCNNKHFSLGKSSLSYEDVYHIARFAIESGATVMDFSGGEPFLFPKIDKLISELGGSDIQLNIVTNGTVMTKEHLTAIANAKNVRIQLSTHGLGEVENKIKRLKNAARKVDANLKKLIDIGAKLSIATVVQKQNLHQLIEIYKHFSKVPYTHHSFVLYEPMGDLSSMFIDPKDVRITSDHAEEFRRQMGLIIEEARADSKAINLDYSLVEKYIERIITETPVEEISKSSSVDCTSLRVDSQSPESQDSIVVKGGLSIAVPDAATTECRQQAGDGAQERHFSHPGMLCSIARRNLFINHNGDVMPCMHFDWKLLNPNCSIANKPIHELVFSREYLDMILTAIGPGGCPGCDAACYIWDPVFRRRATQPNAEDRALMLLSKSNERKANLYQPASEGDSRQASINQELIGRDTRMNSLEQMISKCDIEISHLQQVLSMRENEIRQITASSSWRITRPLRTLKILLNKFPRLIATGKVDT